MSENSASALLELVGTVAVPAIDEFVAREHFKKYVVGLFRGPVRIGRPSAAFRKIFLSGDGKVEKDIAATTLRVHKLTEKSADPSIIAELGGEEVAGTTLAQMYELMKAQGQGQEGILLTRDYCINIFYIPDPDGVLWSVYCYWNSVYGYWKVSVYSVTYPRVWPAGCQVFSC